MNQALLGDSGAFLLEPNEKIGIVFDVRRESTKGDSITQSLGKFVVSNYRLRFIENGKKENTMEQYYSCSMPFGCI